MSATDDESPAIHDVARRRRNLSIVFGATAAALTLRVLGYLPG